MILFIFCIKGECRAQCVADVTCSAASAFSHRKTGIVSCIFSDVYMAQHSLKYNGSFHLLQTFYKESELLRIFSPYRTLEAISRFNEFQSSSLSQQSFVKKMNLSQHF